MKHSPLRPAGLAVLCAAFLASAGATAQHRTDATSEARPAVASAPATRLAQAHPGSEAAVARLSLRISQLEAEIRRLTGENEELAHRVRQLGAQLEKVTGDQELRLRALEEGTRPATPPQARDTGSPAAQPVPAPQRAAPPVAAVPGADRGARVLGTVRQPGAGGAAAPAAETPEQLYDRAYGLLVKQRDYGAAEQVLRSFIDAHPDHALTPNAHYWLGRTYFVQEEFENAAFSFAEGFQKFPKSDKAPDNLLNLGMALSRLGKTQEACTTYARLLNTYTTVDDAIKRRIAREREQAKCRQR